MRVLFHTFSLGAAQTPFALSAQSLRKKPKNHAKLVFLVQNKFLIKNVIMNQKKNYIVLMSSTKKNYNFIERLFWYFKF